MSEQIIIPGPGDLLDGRLELIEELGRGSYGIVFRAKDVLTSQDVAVKTLLPQAFLDPEIVARFTREAQVVSRLQHPNIIQVLSYGQSNGLIYMAMEYIQGRRLADLIESDTPLPAPQARALITQLLQGLEYAHAQGVVHRDLKPDNILLQRGPNGQETIKILDFGIAKLVIGPNDGKDFKTLTQAGHVLGTPHYMSPEQISGDAVSHQADLYSTGIILYELLAGHHPFHDAANSTAVMVRHLHYDPPPLPFGLDQTAWGQAMRWALAKQPAERVPDARAFLTLIADAEDHAQEADEAVTRHFIGALQASTLDDQEPEGATLQLDPQQLRAARAHRPELAPLTQPLLAIDPMDQGQDELRVPPTHAAPSAASGRHAGPSRALIAAVLFLLAFISVGALALIGQERASSSAQAGAATPADPSRRRDDPTLTTSPARRLPPPTRPTQALDVNAAASTTQDSPDLGAEHDMSRSPQPPRTKPDDVEAKDPGKLKPPKVKPPKTKPATLDKVTLTISSSPSGASVLINGRPIVGTTPLTHQLPRDDKHVKIRLSFSGYEDAERSVAPTEDQTLNVRLNRGRIQHIP